MKRLLICVFCVYYISSHGKAFPNPSNNVYNNRYDEVKVETFNEATTTESDENHADDNNSLPDADVELINCRTINDPYSDSDDIADMNEEYDDFVPHFGLNEDFSKYFENFFRNFERSFGKFPFDNYSPYDFDFSQMQPNSAFAAASLGNGKKHQIAAISPENPVLSNKDTPIAAESSDGATGSSPSWFQYMKPFNSPYTPSGSGDVATHGASKPNSMFSWMQNFGAPSSGNQPNVHKFAATGGSGKPYYSSVSSFSSSSSTNINGKNVNHKTAETVVNDNGVITKYRVQDRK